MKKIHSVIIGISLVMIAVLFVVYALNHPEATFPWSNKVTYIIYGVYVGLIFNFLIAIPLGRDILQKNETNSHNIIAAILCVILAAIFLMITLVDKTVSIYTVLQGFIIFVSCDLAIENIRRYLQYRHSNVGSTS